MGNQHAKLCLIDRQPINRVPLADIKYLALGIGSIRGVALMSAYERLLQKGLPPLKGVAGSSVGCVMGLCIVMGLDASTMRRILQEFIEQQGRRFTISVSRSCNAYSWIDNEPLRFFLEQLLQTYQFSPAVTFQQLYDKTKIDYRVVAYNLKSKKTETFGYLTTPTEVVVPAIMASSSIPYIFKPEQIRDVCYIDGGYMNEIPFQEFPLSETMGLYLYDAYRDRKNAKQMFSRLTTQEQDRFISIDVSRVKTTHFHLTAGMHEYLLRQGQRAVDIYYPSGIYPLK